jgi:catechol 2,3-dioxygenase-like lactoylglutathione lyase family enzyme
MRFQRQRVPRRWLRGVLLLCAAVLAGAPSSRGAAAGQEPVVTRAFFALSTGDFDRLVAWYRDNLGFKVDHSSSTGSGVKGALLSRPGALLEVLQLSTAKSRSAGGVPAKPESVHGILKIGFEVADLDGLYSRARERHLDVFFEPTQPAGNPLRTFALKDPDGNIVQFFGK